MLQRLFRLLSSIKFAVFVILVLTAGLIAATFLESAYDTPTAQYYVYRALWFHLVLAMFGVGILVVALSRWPWKKHHTAFLCAHAGILMLLFGSWVTQRFGLDGTLRLDEGQASGAVELPDPVLFVMDGQKVESIPLEWRPPQAGFTPFQLKAYPLKVAEYLSHADPEFSFVPASRPAPHLPAIELRIQGGPMRITQDYWLWAGHPQWMGIQAGPARIELSLKPNDVKTPGANGPLFRAVWNGTGPVKWVAWSSDGKQKSGQGAEGTVIEPGWKGGVTITLKRVLADADAETKYLPSRIQHGNRAAPSAIRLTTVGGTESSMWLGLGERGSLELAGRQIGLAYMPRRLILPFQVKLNRFQIDRYAGTRDPAAYWSNVSVVGAAEASDVKISMNDPLHHRGVTFYQASYEDAEPRPTVSVFSVNRDPGRWWKYLGSLLIVGGSMLLFYQKLKTAGARKRVVEADLWS